MSGATSEVPNPYTPYPGGGPAHDTEAKEEVGELWTFFWLAILNTVIIAAAGIVTWYFFTRH
jgi:hypothetical protein